MTPFPFPKNKKGKPDSESEAPEWTLIVTVTATLISELPPHIPPTMAGPPLF
jgi:hypothetical protein